jgi:hypothetical protein
MALKEGEEILVFNDVLTPFDSLILQYSKEGVCLDSCLIEDPKETNQLVGAGLIVIE